MTLSLRNLAFVGRAGSEPPPPPTFPFTGNSWANGDPGVSSHVWTLRVPKSYSGITADLSLQKNSGTADASDVSCDVDSSGLASALSGWPLDGGVSPAVTDDGSDWVWTITLDSSQVPVDASRSASDFT